MLKKIEHARQALESRKGRSAWDKGVTVYALELLEDLETAAGNGYVTPEQLKFPGSVERILLNGASSWNQYSRGGCSLAYDCDIAARLCTPSELKRTRNGERRPNSREEWLDTQARALLQAAARLTTLIMEA